MARYSIQSYNDTLTSPGGGEVRKDYPADLKCALADILSAPLKEVAFPTPNEASRAGSVKHPAGAHSDELNQIEILSLRRRSVCMH